MTDEDKQKILQAARDTLARPMPTVGFSPTRAESRADRYIREAADAEAERKRERDARLTDAEGARLRAELIGMVASERAFVLEVVGEALGLFMKQLRDEIAESVGLLKADVTLHRAIDQGTVTELPNPILRKTS